MPIACNNKLVYVYCLNVHTQGTCIVATYFSMRIQTLMHSWNEWEVIDANMICDLGCKILHDMDYLALLFDMWRAQQEDNHRVCLALSNLGDQKEMNYQTNASCTNERDNMLVSTQISRWFDIIRDFCAH